MNKSTIYRKFKIKMKEKAMNMFVKSLNIMEK